jgi:hypothetical protein
MVAACLSSKMPNVGQAIWLAECDLRVAWYETQDFSVIWQTTQGLDSRDLQFRRKRPGPPCRRRALGRRLG